MRKLLFTLAGFALLCGQAPPNTIVANYRAYQAALDHGDLAAAETAAAAAFDESTRVDGDAGRTGVLAINLAQVRLARGRFEEAQAPALRAFTIASGNGVDTLLTRLILGHSELTDSRWRSGRARLESALHEATERGDLHGAAYNAAVALGRRLMHEGDFDDAAETWSAAADFSAFAEGDNTYALAESRLWQGAALFNARIAEYRRTGEPSGRTGYHAAHDALLKARELLQPHAMTLPEDAATFTLAQRSYATTLAYDAAMRAFLEGTDQTATAREIYGRRPSTTEPALCSLANHAEPRPVFPPGAQDVYSVGAVVMRIVLNERGETVDSRVAAAVPGRWFEEAVERVATQWRFEALQETGCQVAGVRYLVIPFVFF